MAQIYDAIIIGVLNATDRKLNFYHVIDDTNYSKINKGVWNYTARYTHGEEV